MDLYKVTIPFSMYGKIEYYLNTENILVHDISYGVDVTLELYLRDDQRETFLKKMRRSLKTYRTYGLPMKTDILIFFLRITKHSM